MRRTMNILMLSFITFVVHASFEQRTVVYMEDGCIPIHTVAINQSIVGYDEAREALRANRVVKIQSYVAQHFCTVMCENNIEFITTPQQKCLLYESCMWQEVQNLQCGDELLCFDGSCIKVRAVEYGEQKALLYALTVTPDHTFFVTERGIVVHNAAPIAVVATCLNALPPVTPVTAVIRGVSVVGFCGAALWSVIYKNKKKSSTVTPSGGCSSPPPLPPEDDPEFRKKHPHGRYEDANYHKNYKSGGKSPRPINGQAALDNSYSLEGAANRRIGVSDQQFVVLSKTRDGLYHGHVREWDELTTAMQNMLKKMRIVTGKGKFIK